MRHIKNPVVAEAYERGDLVALSRMAARGREKLRKQRERALEEREILRVEGLQARAREEIARLHEAREDVMPPDVSESLDVRELVLRTSELIRRIDNPTRSRRKPRTKTGSP